MTGLKDLTGVGLVINQGGEISQKMIFLWGWLPETKRMGGRENFRGAMFGLEGGRGRSMMMRVAP